jgi:pyruvate kinase
MSRTRIVATLGPATDAEERLAALLDAGVDVVRLNAAHGTPAEHGARIARIRRLAGDRPVAVLLDLAGPKLRLTHRVVGAPGDVVAIPLPATVCPGDPVLLADGLMHLEVVDVAHARVIVGGDIPAGKGINLPSSRLDMPALMEKDHVHLAFAAEAGVDLVGLSFVRRAADLEAVGRHGLPVVAKIERAEALEHLEDIVAAADGVLVARGDLGVEIPIEKVPLAQKRVIGLSNYAAKPVVTATQMLRSMVDSPLPTRAEATDVANAVLDGTDAVMLSEETAIGRYPVEAVRIMRRIAAEAETALVPRVIAPPQADLPASIAHAACDVAARIGAHAIVVATRSGLTARQVARYRPRAPIVALTPDATVRRRLSIVWGVTALAVPWYGQGAVLLERFREPLRGSGVAPAGAPVVVVGAWPFGVPGTTNLVHVATA